MFICMHVYEPPGTIERCTQRHQCHRVAQGCQAGLQGVISRSQRTQLHPSVRPIMNHGMQLPEWKTQREGVEPNEPIVMVSGNAIVFGRALIP